MGRVQVVRSIVQSMSLYNFHTYAWSIDTLIMIDKSVRNFIWVGDVDKRKMVTISLEKMGGLSIRPLKLINKESILKISWNLLTSNDTRASFYCSRLLKMKLLSFLTFLYPFRLELSHSFPLFWRILCGN